MDIYADGTVWFYPPPPQFSLVYLPTYYMYALIVNATHFKK